MDLSQYSLTFQIICIKHKCQKVSLKSGLKNKNGTQIEQISSKICNAKMNKGSHKTIKVQIKRRKTIMFLWSQDIQTMRKLNVLSLLKMVSQIVTDQFSIWTNKKIAFTLSHQLRDLISSHMRINFSLIKSMSRKSLTLLLFIEKMNIKRAFKNLFLGWTKKSWNLGLFIFI